PCQQGQSHHGRFWSSRRGRKCQTRNFHHRSSERRKTNLSIQSGDRFQSQAFSDWAIRPAARQDLSPAQICSVLPEPETSTPCSWAKRYHTIMKQSREQVGQAQKQTYASAFRI